MSTLTPQQWTEINTALYAYWTAREDAAAAQQAKGVIDVGGRLGVTSGGHLDHVAHLLAEVCMSAGAPADQVYYRRPSGTTGARKGQAIGFTLPGYYRPTKQWDLVVHANGEPIVVLELKSQNGPSYGNNANNRAEEALGNAVDFERARRAGLIPGDPWKGYVYVLEDDMNSESERGQADRGYFARDPFFDDWSYASRVRDLCIRMVDDGFYDAAWAVATSRPSCPGDSRDPKRIKCPQLQKGQRPCSHSFDWHELDNGTSGFASFVDHMATRIRQYYP